MLARARNLLFAAAENVARNGAAYAVAATLLVLALTLLLAGVAVGEGLKEESLASVRSGADLYCTWDSFGRDAAVPAERLAELAAIPGVEDVVPRIVGRLPLAGEIVLVVGVPLARLQREPLPLQGALPKADSEVLVGREVARRLGLAPGSHVGLDAAVVRLFTVAGVIDGTAAFWSAKAVLCDLREAAAVFGDTGHVSDVCIDVRPGYEDEVAKAIHRADRRFRVQTRSLVEAYVARGTTMREGIFTALFALALACAAAAFTIVSWLGQTPRRREIALLKTEGWTTGDVLTMVAFENLLVSVGAAALSLLLAMLLVRGLGAPLVAPFFLPDLPLFPEQRIPARFTPLPALLAVLFSLAVTMSGSILATWRTAIAPPAEALR
jgi:ABC-type lipoprotein release transport system permease subunit